MTKLILIVLVSVLILFTSCSNNKSNVETNKKTNIVTQATDVKNDSDNYKITYNKEATMKKEWMSKLKDNKTNLETLQSENLGKSFDQIKKIIGEPYIVIESKAEKQSVWIFNIAKHLQEPSAVYCLFKNDKITGLTIDEFNMFDEKNCKKYFEIFK